MAVRLPADDVFINCPFDPDYVPIFRALIFAILACGFQPRSAREVDDAGQTRIEKLFGIIAECRYGVHGQSGDSHVTVTANRVVPWRSADSLGFWCFG